eukprot:g12993.t1 g12993   contig7:630237-630698(+)
MKMFGKLLVTLAPLVLLCTSIPQASSFSPPSSRASRVPSVPRGVAFTAPNTATSSSTSLQLSSKPPSDEEKYDTGYVDGSTVGSFLLAGVLLINVWIFSIPTEFRRARMCNPNDVAIYAESRNCMTQQEWAGGIADYYANGGGIKFDFSIEGK